MTVSPVKIARQHATDGDLIAPSVLSAEKLALATKPFSRGELGLPVEES